MSVAPDMLRDGLGTTEAFILRAFDLAAAAHDGQTRWSPQGRVPYLLHPVRVYGHLVRWGVTDRVTLAAGLLHDSVEDAPDRVYAATPTPPHRDLGPTPRGALLGLASAFGHELADTVDGLTNREDGDYLAHVTGATHDPRVLAVKVADFTDNALALDPSHPRFEKLTAKYAPLRSLLATRLSENDAVPALLPAWRDVLATLQ